MRHCAQLCATMRTPTQTRHNQVIVAALLGQLEGLSENEVSGLHIVATQAVTVAETQH